MEEGKDEPSPSGSILDLDLDCLHQILFFVAERTIGDVVSFALTNNRIRIKILLNSQNLWRAICCSRWTPKKLEPLIKMRDYTKYEEGGVNWFEIAMTALKAAKEDLTPSERSPQQQRSVFFYVAENAPIAVVLFRKEKQLFEMISWNLEDDTFVKGQWLREIIRPRECEISPDGTYFLFFVPHTMRRNAYTAMSRPPFFTASGVIEYPKWTFHGGGRFRSPRDVELYETPNYFTSTGRPLYWPSTVSAEYVNVQSFYGADGPCGQKYQHLKLGDWSFHDKSRQRILFSRGTRLYERQQRPELAEDWSEDKLLIDFSTDAFREVKPPSKVGNGAATKPIKFDMKNKSEKSQSFFVYDPDVSFQL